jgi:hypothetical protein
MRRVRIKVVVVTLFTGIALGSVMPLGAHTASTYYPLEWLTDQTYSLGYLEPQINTSTARTSIHTGPAQWNAVSGGTLEFTFSGTVTPSHTWESISVCNTIGNVWVISRVLSGLAGNTTNCGNGTNITKSTIQFHDTATGNWYVGSGTPGNNPSGGLQTDLRSISTHEFGHAMGFRSSHFSVVDLACQSPIHTMCSGYTAGSTYKRSTEIHEEHTFAAAY